MSNSFEEIMAEESRRSDTIKEIRERFPEVNFPAPVLEPMFYGRLGEKRPVLERKLVVDKPSGFQYDIVSDQYKLVHHEEVVKMVLESCPPEFGTPEFKIKMLLNGARAMVQATFSEMGKFKVNGSVINPMIRMINSINRSTNLMYVYGAEELVCTNGLVMFREQEKSKQRHMIHSLNTSELQAQIRGNLEEFSETNQIWNKWAETQLSEIEVLKVIEDLPFTEREKEGLVHVRMLNHGHSTLADLNKENKATLWAVNSAATQFASHEIKSEHRALNLETEIGRIIQGYNK